MKKATFVLAGLAAFAGAGKVSAQVHVPLSVEVRADAAIPTGEWADAVETAPGFTGSASLGLIPGLAVYGSYSRTQFELKDTDIDATDEGFSVGLTAGVPLGAGSRLQPYIGGGLLIHDLKVEDAADNDSDLGFELGAGVAVPLANHLRLTPSVGYRSYETDVPTLLGSEKLNVSYFTAGAGISIAF